MRKLLVGAGVVAAALIASTVPALAQQYPPAACGLTLGTASVAPGGAVTVATSSGCTGVFAAGTTVTITLSSDPVTLATVTTDSSGLFSTSVTIPEGTSPGLHTLSATGTGANGSTVVLSTQIEVTGAGAAAAAAGRGTLSFTGSESATLAWLGVGALSCGLICLIAIRRRRTVRERAAVR